MKTMAEGEGFEPPALPIWNKLAAADCLHKPIRPACFLPRPLSPRMFLLHQTSSFLSPFSTQCQSNVGAQYRPSPPLQPFAYSMHETSSHRGNTSNINHTTRLARLQNRPQNEVHNRRNAGEEQRHQRYDPPQSRLVQIKRMRQSSAYARDHLLIAASIKLAHAHIISSYCATAPISPLTTAPTAAMPSTAKTTPA